MDTTAKIVSVLIVDDSPTMRRHLADMIEAAPGIRVAGEARDGDEVLQQVEKLRPDVVSMDIRMPGMDGLEATRHIMNRCPTPVVVVSGLVEREVDLAFQALQAGALAVVEKPGDRNAPDFPSKQRQLLNTLVAMSKVHVVRRWELGEAISPPPPRTIPEPGAAEIVAIGASAGGPSALSLLLRDFPANYPLPIVITQHMPDGFTAGLARWLDKSTVLPVCVTEDGQKLTPGMVHLAPGEAHLIITRHGGGLRTRLLHEQGEHRYWPSVNVLFESVANTCGAASIGVVLTGMGDDGTAGLLAIRQAGGTTYAQDESSSTVFGMPGAAIAAGAVDYVLSLSNLANALARLKVR